ncbi:Senecionine N-oxygenase [Microbotryomycetes sp. JL221]|nr:Senecionine N-oxygenase [Microbotryomycetes sp. JL221]
MILLAKDVVGNVKAGFQGLGGLDMSVVRNQWGRQSESFAHQVQVDTFSEPFNAVFIRAPVVHTVELKPTSGGDKDEPRLEVLARVPRSILPLPTRASLTTGGTELGPDADVVMVKQGNVVASSFHPELTGDYRVHEWFVKSLILAAAD